MRRSILLAAVLLGTVSRVHAGPFTVGAGNQVVRLNTKLNGCVLDYTRNHFHNRRIWSESLQSYRDLYVYLPPGYDPEQKYPLMIWMHGFIQDEKDFLDIIPAFDRAIACGQMPPMVIAAPDGSITGRPSFIHAGSFFINSRAGCFENFIIRDVYPFVLSNFSIRPEPEAHILGGASMGGFGAYNLAIKYRKEFRVVVGIMTPLNWRYQDCDDRYIGDFDPACFNYADRYRPHSTIACFFKVIHIQQRHLIEPLFGKNRQEVVRSISRENPIEMLETYSVEPGELAMFIGSAGKDEFNLDAQIDSFMFVARQRGIEATVVLEPDGRHNSATGLKILPEFCKWITPLIKPYSPPLVMCSPAVK